MRMILAAAFFLTSCWTGDSLYTDRDARPAFQNGTYLFTGEGEPPAQLTVINLQNGLTQIAKGDEVHVVGLAPLDAVRRSYVWWNSEQQQSQDRGFGVYLLVVNSRPGEYRLYMPSCSGRDARIARSRGARILRLGGGYRECRFSSRRDLDAALLALQPDQLGHFSTLVRIP